MNQEEKLLNDIFDIAISDPANLMNFLKQNQNQVSFELAERAKKIADHEASSNRLGNATAAYRGATNIFLLLGYRKEALYCYFQFWQIQYMLCKQPSDYLAVREQISSLLEKCLEVKAEYLIFRIYFVMADSAFWASEETKTPKDKDDLLLTVLQDLSNATKSIEGNNERVWIEQYVSLVSTIISKVNSNFFLLEQEKKFKDEVLEEITQGIEKQVETNFVYQKIPSDLNKTCQTLTNLAYLSYRYGDMKVGSERFRIASEVALTAKNDGIWLDIISKWHSIEKEYNDNLQELKKLQDSIFDKMESFRKSFKSRAGRLWCTQFIESSLSEILQSILRERKDEQIFEIIERLKARTLLDYMQIKPKEFQDKKISEIIFDKEKKLLRFNSPTSKSNVPEIIQFEGQLMSRLSIGTAFDRSERHLQQEEIEELYRLHNAGFEKTSNVTTMRKIQTSLKGDEILLEFFMPNHPTHPSIELWVIIITSKESKVLQIPLDSLKNPGMIGIMSIDGQQPLDVSPLGNFIGGLRVDIQEGTEKKAIKKLEECYDLIILPIIESGFELQNFKRCIIVPHGVLHYLPFAALKSKDGSFLIEHVEIIFAPSSTIFYELRKKQIPEFSSFLALGNPDLSKFKLPPLKESAKELESINEYVDKLESFIYNKEKATESILRKQSSGKSIIHFATHGEFPEEDIIDSHRIMLTPSKTHDGNLNADEIRTLKLNSAGLVILSICNGGIYRCGPGDEPYGLVPAFFISGVRNVIGSIWPLEDKIGRYFMEEYYSHLLVEGVSRAIQKTCKAFIRDKLPIRTWTSFILIGDGQSHTSN
ncbi:hypothetical protein NKOR_02350 [Candidatus Nitrosopumilus koreensis AR1]|uniref:CHAT domain-containing protein n=1 Tax=Candidatus Nitrosopumilus koreensis AR1 TaxID=1229908 RepID=K0B2X1_9ARCH|nr:MULTISPECIES: CHAT domain-containing protein [Nitrosopumilus]AFS80368.1 hypothetical protein NKOR_02350 [Candidatus Nitrosopumilus koreensis AR1]